MLNTDQPAYVPPVATGSADLTDLGLGVARWASSHWPLDEATPDTEYRMFSVSETESMRQLPRGSAC